MITFVSIYVLMKLNNDSSHPRPCSEDHDEYQQRPYFPIRFEVLGSFPVILQDDEKQKIMMVGKIGVPPLVAIALFPYRAVPLSRKLRIVRQSIISVLHI